MLADLSNYPTIDLAGTAVSDCPWGQALELRVKANLYSDPQRAALGRTHFTIVFLSGEDKGQESTYPKALSTWHTHTECPFLVLPKPCWQSPWVQLGTRPSAWQWYPSLCLNHSFATADLTKSTKPPPVTHRTVGPIGEFSPRASILSTRPAHYHCSPLP